MVDFCSLIPWKFYLMIKRFINFIYLLKYEGNQIIKLSKKEQGGIDLKKYSSLKKQSI